MRQNHWSEAQEEPLGPAAWDCVRQEERYEGKRDSLPDSVLRIPSGSRPPVRVHQEFLSLDGVELRGHGVWIKGTAPAMGSVPMRTAILMTALRLGRVGPAPEELQSRRPRDRAVL